MLSRSNSPNGAKLKFNKQRDLSLATEIVRVNNTCDNSCYHNASAIPIFQTATFRQTSATEMGDYDYTRSGNPTRAQTEQHLARIMSATSAFLVNSGMSALDVILRVCCKPGDEILTGEDLYGGTNRLLSFIQSSGGISARHVDTTDVEAVGQALISDRTCLVLLETPTNPLIKIADIRRICAAVRRRAPTSLVCVDNTMMSPYLQRPLELGADIVYHSATKYLSGHHDQMAGVIGVASEEIADKFRYIINAIGCGLPPFECFLLSRGVKTLAIRMDRQQSNAGRIAEFLSSHGFTVYYPGLLTHPQHDLHFSQASGAGAVLSFKTGNVEKSRLLVESCRLWTISVSFGCVNSLISMPCYMSHASIPEHVRRERNLPQDLIRLCVGIEDVEDLLGDLKQAMIQADLLSNMY